MLPAGAMSKAPICQKFSASLETSGILLQLLMKVVRNVQYFFKRLEPLQNFVEGERKKLQT